MLVGETLSERLNNSFRSKVGVDRGAANSYDAVVVVVLAADRLCVAEGKVSCRHRVICRGNIPLSTVTKADNSDRVAGKANGDISTTQNNAQKTEKVLSGGVA